MKKYKIIVICLMSATLMTFYVMDTIVMDLRIENKRLHELNEELIKTNKHILGLNEELIRNAFIICDELKKKDPENKYVRAIEPLITKDDEKLKTYLKKCKENFREKYEK